MTPAPEPTRRGAKNPRHIDPKDPSRKSKWSYTAEAIHQILPGLIPLEELDRLEAQEDPKS